MTFSKLAALGLVGLVASPALADDTKAAPAASSELKDLKQKASYGIGVSIARDFKAKGLELDFDALSKGMKDASSGGKCLLTDEQLEEALQAFQKDFVAKAGERRKTMAAENKKKGEAFLAANKQKPGVKTLPSGLQYKVIRKARERRRRPRIRSRRITKARCSTAPSSTARTSGTSRRPSRSTGSSRAGPRRFSS